MESWRKSYTAYKRLATYRDGEYAYGFLRDNLRNLLLAAVVASGALLLNALSYALADTVSYVRVGLMLVLTLMIGLGCMLIIYVLEHTCSARGCIWIRNMVVLGLLVGVDFLLCEGMTFSGGLYVYPMALLVLVVVPNFRIHETFLILLWLNLSVCFLLQSGSELFSSGQLAMHPYRYMIFCSFISLVIAVRHHIDYLLLVRQRAILQTASETDPLTGLLNRRGMEAYLKKRNYGWNISMVLFDIDDFKSYNDTYGHVAGDECLRTVAECFMTVIGKKDGIAVRYGGEEFILLFFLADKEEARRQTNLCLEAMRKKQLPAGTFANYPYVTLSAGLVVSEEPPRQDVERCYALAALADRNLYAAKAFGKNQCVG
jgi:diguanylate cyclase (GGDEF)-like protein